jgi:hypothetical protein
MADTLESKGNYLPKDLRITAQPDAVDKDKFKVVATGLKINESYVFQFQYVFEDDSLSQWSPGYALQTSNESSPGVPTGTIVPSTATGSIPVELPTFPTGARKVDVIVTNGIFGLGKIAYTFLAAGKATIAAPAGTYIVQLRATSAAGVTSTVGTTHTITVSDAGETVQSPTNPTGFSINRVLGGIEVVWDGTYANGTFTGFEAIKIYVGNTAVATSGTYREAGAMTGNNVRNSIVVPVDGTYLRYSQPVYVHAAAVNRSGTVGTLQQNVASNLLGAKSAVSDDLDNQIITNAKLVDSAVTEAKIATSAITETKIATDAITSTKIVANAITADKIVSSAITADKIATNAVTATKILAGTIDVSKLAAGTISVNNLEAGNINSTSYIRAGTAGSARVELSSANISGGPSAGFYIYNSAGTPVLSAPLNGGLTIVGNGTFSGTLSGASGNFTGDLYSSNNQFSVISGSVTALSGTIGGWVINEQAFKSSAVAYPKIELDPISPKFEIRQSASDSSESGIKVIKIDPIDGIRAGTTSNFKFRVDMDGNMTATDAIFSSGQFNGNITSSATISGGTISGGTVVGSRVQTTSIPYWGSIRMGYSDGSFGAGSTLDVVGDDGSVYGQLYQFNNGNELILRHGSSRTVLGYPTGQSSPTSQGAYLSLNPYTTSLGYADSIGGSTYGLDITSSGDNRFTGTLQSDSSGGANSVGNTTRYIRNTIITNTAASGSGFSIGDIWIQY